MYSKMKVCNKYIGMSIFKIKVYINKSNKNDFRLILKKMSENICKSFTNKNKKCKNKIKSYENIYCHKHIKKINIMF